jgi:hypothetical protein
MKAVKLPMGVCFALGLATWLAVPAHETIHAQDHPGAPTAWNEELGDKILLLEVAGSENNSSTKSVFIEKARLVVLGDRYVVLGIGYTDGSAESGWYKGVTIGVPWEHVLQFHAMTPEQFKKYMSDFEKYYRDDDDPGL